MFSNIDELGKFIFEFHLHASGEKRKGFDHPLDVRILRNAGVFAQHQPAGDTGTFGRELLGAYCG